MRTPFSERFSAVYPGNLRANSYARLVSSSCSRRDVCVSAFGIAIAEYESPVTEKVESSTPVIARPSAVGKDDFCADSVSLCRTMLLRSPWFSALPARSVYLRCAAHNGNS